MNQTNEYEHRNIKPKYAIVVLLMISDAYLIGCLTLAQSILSFKESHSFDLVCMVTPDISQDAINELKKYYTYVKLVDYINIKIERIKHSNEEIKKIYSKTFTKFQALTLTQYKKIILMDVDMLVIRKEFFNIFNIQTPAVPFSGCFVFNKYKTKLNELYNKLYPKLKHGELIPPSYYDYDCYKIYKQNNINKIASTYIESAIGLWEPNISDYKKIIKILYSSDTKTYKGDTSLWYDYYKYKFHYIDSNYIGRWINPLKDENIIVLDLYGYHGKPWEIDKFNSLILYDDALYWMKQFIIYYEKSFKYNCKIKSIHILYDFLKKNIK